MITEMRITRRRDTITEDAAETNPRRDKDLTLHQQTTEDATETCLHRDKDSTLHHQQTDILQEEVPHRRECLVEMIDLRKGVREMTRTKGNDGWMF